MSFFEQSSLSSSLSFSLSSLSLSLFPCHIWDLCEWAKKEQVKQSFRNKTICD